MSDATRAVLWAALIGIVILLGPIALFAAGLVGIGGVLAIQAGVLLVLYLAAVVIRGRRDDG
jgi:hypothetical protein